MARLGQPLDRETYLAFCYGKDIPAEISAEEQAELPPQFQDVEPAEDPEEAEKPAPAPEKETEKKRVRVIRDEEGTITGFESY